MIVDTAGLEAVAGTVTMVDGGFDPLHDGHVRYFLAAAALGDPVLCNVSGDAWVARKHAPLLSHAQRTTVIDAMRSIAYTHPSSVPTVEVLARLRPRRYAKGRDWRGRLPEAEIACCERHGIEIVFLDTVIGSSTALLQAFAERQGMAP